MSDEALKALARRAGIALEWRDYADKSNTVSIETVRCILSALGFACDTAEAIADSTHRLESPAMPPLITTTVRTPVELPIDANRLGSARIVAEDGAILGARLEATSHGARLYGLEKPGYHVLEFGDDRVTLAAAPPRCFTVGDIAANQRLWGLAVQATRLRGPGDAGIGDMGERPALANEAAELKADALVLSPIHALFAANPTTYSPYSPSSRLFYNPLLADPRPLFGGHCVQEALAKAEVPDHSADLIHSPLIDWPRASDWSCGCFATLR